MASLIHCLVITVLHWWTVDSGKLAVDVVCLEVMMRTGTTEGSRRVSVQRHRRRNRRRRRLLVNRCL